MNNLYVAKIVNTSESEIDTPAGLLIPNRSVAVFFNLKIFKVAFDWLGAFDSGLKALNFTEDEISVEDAYPSILNAQRLAGNYSLDLTGKALWNIDVSRFILASVRSEILSSKLSDFNTSWSEVVTKLQMVTALVQLGMLDEASKVVLSIPRDLFLTDDRLSRWSLLCKSSDALAKE